MKLLHIIYLYFRQMKIGNRREERVEDMEVEEAGEARAGGSRVVEGEDVLRQIDEVLGTYERKEPTDQVQTFLKGGQEGEQNVGEGKKIGGGELKGEESLSLTLLRSTQWKM